MTSSSKLSKNVKNQKWVFKYVQVIQYACSNVYKQSKVQTKTVKIKKFFFANEMNTS